MRKRGWLRGAGWLVALLTLAGCIGPGQQPEPTHYLLQWTPPEVPVGTVRGPTLLVTGMRAQPGFDSPRMAYTRAPNRIDYYAHSRWADVPARMLMPLVVQALEAERAFAAVVAAPASVRAALRLDTQLVQLSQEFGGTRSQVRLVVRAQLVEGVSQAVVATRSFESVVPAPSEDAAGGAAAANQAVAELLPRLAAWCAQAVKER